MSKKTPKKVVTDEERAALANLLYSSSLFSAHPIIVTNVCAGVSELLAALGRPDLIPVWADQEGLMPYVVSPRGTE